MANLRFQVVAEAFRKQPVEVEAPKERPSEFFAKYVFNKAKMYKYLPKKVYDKMLDVRDWELEEIGHAMVGLQQKTLSSSTADADKASKLEEAKNEVTSTPEKSGAEN